MFYFSYGSNMLRERLAARVGDVVSLGPARLPGYRVAFIKRSIDGSGKCTLIQDRRSSAAWGVVFELTIGQKALLDEYEGPGYAVETVEAISGAARFETFTYVGRPGSLDQTLDPYSWYKALVLAGAAQAGLPRRYIEALETVAAVEDRDQDRTRDNLRLLKASR